MTLEETPLRYIDASHVDTPAGSLNAIDVVDAADEPVGKLDGVVFDPIERQLRYFVVESRRRLRAHRYLVPMTPARLDAEHHKLHVELQHDDFDALTQVDAESFPPFSDNDLVDALFSSPSR